MLPTPLVSAERRRTDDCTKLAEAGGHVVCKKSTPLQFIPNLKYLFKVSVTVTYSQRQEYPHFVGASLSFRTFRERERERERELY